MCFWGQDCSCLLLWWPARSTSGIWREFRPLETSEQSGLCLQTLLRFQYHRPYLVDTKDRLPHTQFSSWRPRRLAPEPKGFYALQCKGNLARSKRDRGVCTKGGWLEWRRILACLSALMGWVAGLSYLLTLARVASPSLLSFPICKMEMMVLHLIWRL